jgi:predicted cupin superfamily sugar epimerase
MDTAPRRAADVIAALGLEPHPEGGFFRETFRASATVEAVQGRRAGATAIAFLLTLERPSRFHRLLSDELWVHRGGAPLELWLLAPDGAARSVLLGSPDADARLGTRPAARVSAHVWQAARVAAAPAGGGPSARPSARPTARPDAGWSLVTCVVTPGFDYADFELGHSDVLLAGWPCAAVVIGELT